MKQLSESTMRFLRSSIGLDYEDKSMDSEIRNYAPVNMFHKLCESFGLNPNDDSITLLLNSIEDIWGVELSGAVCEKCGRALPRDEQKESFCANCRTTVIIGFPFNKE